MVPGCASGRSSGLRHWPGLGWAGQDAGQAAGQLEAGQGVFTYQ